MPNLHMIPPCYGKIAHLVGRADNRRIASSKGRPKKYNPDEETIERIKRLRKEGHTYRSIMQKTGMTLNWLKVFFTEEVT